MTPPALSGYLVQVAAVTKPEDAEALVNALKKKQYPAFAVNHTASDKLYRVQVGPHRIKMPKPFAIVSLVTDTTQF